MLFVLFICLHVFKQHNYVLICHCIMSHQKLENTTYQCISISTVHRFISQAYKKRNIQPHRVTPIYILGTQHITFTSSCWVLQYFIYSQSLSLNVQGGLLSQY